MHRIDVPSATVDNLFTEGSPTGGIPATTVAAGWLNDLQENVCEAIEGAGITLSKGDSQQLLLAIQAIAGGGLGPGGTSSSDYVKIPYADKVTGVKRMLVVQWGTGVTAATETTHNYPIAFPASVFQIVGSDAGVSTLEYVGLEKLSNTQFKARASSGTPGFAYIALGL
jgi:hypothetical protein